MLDSTVVVSICEVYFFITVSYLLCVRNVLCNFLFFYLFFSTSNRAESTVSLNNNFSTTSMTSIDAQFRRVELTKCLPK